MRREKLKREEREVRYIREKIREVLDRRRMEEERRRRY